MQLRRTTTADADFRALVSLLDAELRDTYGALQDQYAPHNHVETIATAVVALDGETAVGCGCFRRQDPCTIEVKRMFVAPQVRGRRIASTVLEELEAWARELGHDTAVLETGNLQHAALALYTRCGYERIPNFPPYVDMAASVCMRKRL